DVQATGTLLNPLAYAIRGDTLRGTASVRSKHFNLDEWQSGGGQAAAHTIAVPPRIDLDLNATVAELLYRKLKMTNARGNLRVRNKSLSLQDFRMSPLGGAIGLSGTYETTNPAKPTFDVRFNMTKAEIPAAFQAFTTVQMLAPVARYALGNVSVDLRLNGA